MTIPRRVECFTVVTIPTILGGRGSDRADLALDSSPDPCDSAGAAPARAPSPGRARLPPSRSLARDDAQSHAARPEPRPHALRLRGGRGSDRADLALDSSPDPCDSAGAAPYHAPSPGRARLRPSRPRARLVAGSMRLGRSRARTRLRLQGGRGSRRADLALATTPNPMRLGRSRARTRSVSREGEAPTEPTSRSTRRRIHATRAEPRPTALRPAVIERNSEKPNDARPRIRPATEA